jgi:ribosome-associated toxin RatA of RatAB toxin-antitoxin module
MDTHIELLVRAEAATVYGLAAAVEHWPRLLPHYRWVRVLGVASDGTRTVEMAARRDVLWSLGVPLRWTAIQTLHPDEPRISFEHIGGPTRGMRVAWTFQTLSGGVVRVDIRHLFEPSWPVPGDLVRMVVGEYFVNGVAARTLRCIGQLAEASPRPRHAPQAR